MTTTVVGVGTIVIYVGRERPGWDLWWMDDSNDPIDLSSGYTFAVTIRQGATDTVLAGAVVTANSTPSATVATLNVAPAVTTLDALTTGRATIIVVATTGGLDREAQFEAVVRT